MSPWLIGTLAVVGLVALVLVFLRARGRSEVSLGDGPGGPELRLAYRAWLEGDREPLAALFASHREGHWNDRAFYVDQLVECFAAAGRERDVDTLLAAWVDEEPDDALAQLLYGARCLCRGWPPPTYSEERPGAPELELLEGAEEALTRASNLDPRDPTAKALLINTITARGGDERRAKALFEEAREVEPSHLAAHVAMLRHLGPRWHGDREAMFRFARSAVSKVRVGSAVNGLLAYAHLESWRSYRDSGDSSAARAYLGDESNRIEVFAAFARFCAGECKDRDTTYVKNQWACWFYLTRDRMRLQALVPVLLHTPTKRPWIYLGPPQRVIQRALRLAGS